MPVPSRFLELAPEVLGNRVIPNMSIIDIFEVSLTSRRAAELVRRSKPHLSVYDIRVSVRRPGCTTVQILAHKTRQYPGGTSTLELLFEEDNNRYGFDDYDMYTCEDVREKMYLKDRNTLVCGGSIEDVNLYLSLVHQHLTYIFNLDDPDNKAFKTMALTKKEMLILTPFVSDDNVYLKDLELRGGRAGHIVAPYRAPINEDIWYDEDEEEAEEFFHDFGQDEDDDHDMNELDVLYGTSFRNITIVHSTMTAQNINRFLVDWFDENEEMHELESLTVNCPQPVNFDQLIANIDAQPWNPDRRDGIYREIEADRVYFRDYRTALDLERNDGRLLTICLESPEVVRIFRWKQPFSDYSDELVGEIKIVREESLVEVKEKREAMFKQVRDLLDEMERLDASEKPLLDECAELEEEIRQCDKTVKAIQSFLHKV